MEIEGALVLITGANRGIGLALANAAIAAGARKVYAGMRNPAPMPSVEPVRLDVTDAAQIAQAAQNCADVTLLINNAGIGLPGGFLSDEGSEAAILRHMQVNVFGILGMCRAFAPVLSRNGGGAVLNVLSVASWTNSPRLGPYGLSKSAAWALTNGLRTELRAQGTLGQCVAHGLCRYRTRARFRLSKDDARRRGDAGIGRHCSRLGRDSGGGEGARIQARADGRAAGLLERLKRHRSGLRGALTLRRCAL